MIDTLAVRMDTPSTMITSISSHQKPPNCPADNINQDSQGCQDHTCEYMASPNSINSGYQPGDGLCPALHSERNNYVCEELQKKLGLFRLEYNKLYKNLITRSGSHERGGIQCDRGWIQVHPAPIPGLMLFSFAIVVLRTVFFEDCIF